MDFIRAHEHKHHNTTPQHNTTAQHHSTTPQHNTTAQHHSTTPNLIRRHLRIRII
jgi:hypothetical protein